MEIKHGKILMASLLLIASSTIVGCSKDDSLAVILMKQKSGILEDENYLSYQEVSSNESKGEQEELIKSEKSIHVTFAQNSRLTTLYYEDPSYKKLISSNEYYLEPNKPLYAKIGVKEGKNSSAFSLSEIRVINVTSGTMEGKMDSEPLATVDSIDGQEYYTITIPTVEGVKEIAILPISKLESEKILLNDYYVDDNGIENPVDYKWIIDGNECHDETIYLDPLSIHSIKYEYDNNEYFYLSASPEPFGNDMENGIVDFKNKKPGDSVAEYKVELHKRIELSIATSKNRDVQYRINYKNVSQSKIEAGKSLFIQGLAFNDRISIETDAEWPELSGGQDYTVLAEPLSDGTYRYTLTVISRSDGFWFVPSQYNYDHGKLQFIYNGRIVGEEMIWLTRGTTLQYESTDSEEGYWIGEGEHSIVIEDEETTLKKIENLRFTERVEVNLSLPQPACGGRIEYRVNGARVYGDQISVLAGTKIKMKLNAWEGWIVKVPGEPDYIVEDTDKQIININGMQIGSIFEEDESHKPVLSVILDKSIGENIEFKLNASGYNMSSTKYGGGITFGGIFDGSAKEYSLDNSQRIINDQKIGTDSPIEIQLSNRTAQRGKAVKIEIVKTDMNNKAETDIQYYSDPAFPIPPIYIYSSSSQGLSPKWYKSIELTLSIADVFEFTQSNRVEHARVVVQNADTYMTLQSGDLIESNQRVILTVKGERGYYLTGKKVSNDMYQQSMKYSDYLKNVEKILSECEAKPYINIYLSKNDKFAEYTYKLDGKIVSGNIEARSGQKLELTYMIIDEAYSLSNPSGGLFGLGANDKKLTKSIIIDESMQGSTIGNADFAIETKRGK